MDEEIFTPSMIILGIFGHTNKITEKDLHENTLTLLLQELGRLPDKVLVPAEGNSSIYIQLWAESLGINIQIFQSDWTRNGKVAQIIRDNRINSESTHFLIILPESTKIAEKLEKFAMKSAKKGKHVFTSSDQTLTCFEIPSCVHEKRAPQNSTPVRKSDTKIAQMWQKYQMKSGC
jgi:hypothetical protein